MKTPEQKASDAERARRYRERKARESLKLDKAARLRGEVPASQARHSTSRRRSANSADGVLLGVAVSGYVGVPGLPDDDGRWIPNRAHQARLKGTTSEADLDAIDARINPEHVPHASVVLASGSWAYLASDEADCYRVARLICAEPEVEFTPLADLAAALGSVRPGSTFTLRQETP